MAMPRSPAPEIERRLRGSPGERQKDRAKQSDRVFAHHAGLVAQSDISMRSAHVRFPGIADITQTPRMSAYDPQLSS